MITLPRASGFTRMDEIRAIVQRAKDSGILQTTGPDARRSVAKQLALYHGIEDANTTVAICRSLAALCFYDRTRRLSVGQILTIFRAFEPSVRFVLKDRSQEYGLRQVGVLAAFAFAVAADDGVIPLYGALLTGEGAAARQNAPLWHLRRFLLSDAARALTRGTDRGLAELVLQAIYLERMGRTVARLDLAPQGASYFRSAVQGLVARIGEIIKQPKAA